jgi:glutaconate CoA-transferase subunit A
VNKLVSLDDAASLVTPGTVLGVGGMTLYRRPLAFVRALLRVGVADLTLVALTCGYESDLLVGAGCVRRVRTCYFGLETAGLAPMFTRWAGAGRIEVVEETEASLAFGLRATLAGVGFMPGRGWLGTDLPRVRPDVKTVDNPYSNETYVAFPAFHVDVAAIHAVAADRLGNARLGGNLALDREMALVAGQVVVTAERVVDRLEAPADLMGVTVTAVVEAPRGAWPTSCAPVYGVDVEELLDYVEACAAGRFEAYLAPLLAGEPAQC